MYLRRARVVGRSFVAALTRASRAVTPLAPAVQYLGADFRRPCWGPRGKARRFGRAARRCYQIIRRRRRSRARRTPPYMPWYLSGSRTGPPACAQFRAKKQPGSGEHAGEKGREGAEKRKKLRVLVWHGKQKIVEMSVARACVSRA
jgi:hypothetical protein